MTTEERLEIEVKVRIDSPETWRERLPALGARPLYPRAFERNLVFDSAERELQKRGVLLRLRQAADRSLLTMKMPGRAGSAYKVRRETEVGVGDFAAAEKILRGIGLAPVFAYEKYRQVFRLAAVLLMLDETPIGDFLEIEGEPAAIDEAAARLGFARGDYITDSYHRLFLAAGHRGDMVFSP
ncbi:MAG: class IV adenylate cyclase [Candidatus Aminicenantes bacterium]|nr:class IV adenylate cyclase [Candidatus Aminicenantes bacterium]